MREKEFINKVHKALPKSIYRWKIFDPYHGGVPDAFYAGPKNHCFVEYKYQENLPKNPKTDIKINLTLQQREVLRLHQNNKILAFWVFGSKSAVYMCHDVDKTVVKRLDFNEHSMSFSNYVKKLVELCIGEEIDD